MKDQLATELRHVTKNAKRITAQRGFCLGETPPKQTLAVSTKMDIEHELRHNAHLMKDYYSMPIERRHQSRPELFDPLDYPPNTDLWPHEEMLKSLIGHAKAVADWAKEQGFVVTIADVHLYDPIRKKNQREYHLVLSWSEEKSAEAAA